MNNNFEQQMHELTILYLQTYNVAGLSPAGLGKLYSDTKAILTHTVSKNSQN